VRTVVVGVVLAVTVAAIAVAAIPDSSGVIHGCYRKVSGDLRLVDKAGDCRKHEQAITWNQQGRAGNPGPPGPPGPKGGSGTAFDEKTAQVTVQSTTPVEAGGPTVTVDVPASGVISVWARAELQATAGGDAMVALHDAPAGKDTFLLSAGGSGFQPKWTSPGCCSGLGVENAFQAGWVVLETTPGPHTFSLRYAQSNSTSASFRNRKLVVTPAG
jgi:hypothetical protein